MKQEKGSKSERGRSGKERKGMRKRTDAEMFEAMKRTEPTLRPDLFLAGYYD
jgi:hypothetical protein